MNKFETMVERYSNLDVVELGKIWDKCLRQRADLRGAYIEAVEEIAKADEEYGMFSEQSMVAERHRDAVERALVGVYFELRAVHHAIGLNI